VCKVLTRNDQLEVVVYFSPTISLDKINILKSFLYQTVLCKLNYNSLDSNFLVSSVVLDKFINSTI
jgi:lipid A disaccharide synthetase